MTMRGHDHFEILISASLAGDISDTERQQLDAHLDSCAQCRATLAAFADQRRVVAGLRHVPPPRDLGARVRAGIESGAHAQLPWWRRPAVIFAGIGGSLAAVAGALLALVILNGTPDDVPVGVASEEPMPTATLASATLAPTPQQQSSTPEPTPSATAAPTPTPAPPAASPEPDVYLAYTGPFDNLALTLRDGQTGETLMELETPAGPPIAAELSPNGQFLAYITRAGESGMNDYWVARVGGAGDERLAEGAAPQETLLGDGDAISLGRGVAGSEFVERLSWSPDSRFLATTLVQPGVGPDVWITDLQNADTWRHTEYGSAFAGSWLADDVLLISIVIDGRVSTDPVGVRSGMTLQQMPGTNRNVGGVFQPAVSPSGNSVIYWTGLMERSGDEWLFVQGGAPYLADLAVVNGQVQLSNERPLFADVTIERDAFTSAGITWGVDGDAYAVWNAQWTGTSQGANSEYPSPTRVYFGHASDDRNLTEVHAIDEGDVPEGFAVVDVEIPTANHLLITAQQPIGGVLEAPRAQLLLVRRNTGDVPDDVQRITGPGSDSGWFGPAALDAYWELTAE